ncbi:chaperonin, partial [Candidatus Campbellbacteria bacterium CG10_big_fil_rev_8_21_14_0_10_35_52]
AGILLTTEVAIADEPEEDKSGGVGGGMSAGMPGMGGF